MPELRTTRQSGLTNFTNLGSKDTILEFTAFVFYHHHHHHHFLYIPETNYVPGEYSVTAILLLLFMVHTSPAPVLNLLHFYISIFRSMGAVPNMAVFCSSLITCFPGTLLRYFLNDFEMIPVALIITGITFVFTFHMYFYCKVFIFQNLLGFFFNHISVSWDCNVY